ncbi:DUF1254 domain-containing protein [Nocardia sp. NPDC005825]|uniref:DUF1254 domain-containing protein n=1 Tax=unclassified Nocardia TaxID=2637762 RepID=UPI0033E569E1
MSRRSGLGIAAIGLAALTAVTLTACDSSSDSKNGSTSSTASSASETKVAEYPLGKPITVTSDNFVRAESDRQFDIGVKEGAFGKWNHFRELMPIDAQAVVRANRDTLYSNAIVDLDAGPVTVTMPDAGSRFMSLQAIDEDEYTPQVSYKPGKYTFDKDKVGTRYLMLGVRIFVDPNSPSDVDAVHKLQDQIGLEQSGGPGTFEIPQWDQASQDTTRAALITLAAGLPDTKNSFGPRGQVDQVRHLITAASAWGGNPEQDALYLNVTPPENNGQVNYKLHVKDVPVDGFWSVSRYNAQGYYDANAQNAYTVNGTTAEKNADGSVDIQLGGCDGQVANCLPIVPGWNYMVRLYRPHQSILDGTWTFPQAEPMR